MKCPQQKTRWSLVTRTLNRSVGMIHSQSGTSQRNGAEGDTLFSRSATNRQAVMRSAVVPGFSLLPSHA